MVIPDGTIVYVALPLIQDGALGGCRRSKTGS
jgi:hypothetical protein